MIAKCALANLWSEALVSSAVIIMHQIREDYYDRCRCVDITARTRIFDYIICDCIFDCIIFDSIFNYIIFDCIFNYNLFLLRI